MTSKRLLREEITDNCSRRCGQPSEFPSNWRGEQALEGALRLRHSGLEASSSIPLTREFWSTRCCGFGFSYGSRICSPWLAALIPPARGHLVRYRGELAPGAPLRRGRHVIIGCTETEFGKPSELQGCSLDAYRRCDNRKCQRALLLVSQTDAPSLRYRFPGVSTLPSTDEDPRPDPSA